jgi:phenylacetic acid degradation operon negative regulatory protein
MIPYGLASEEQLSAADTVALSPASPSILHRNLHRNFLVTSAVVVASSPGQGGHVKSTFRSEDWLAGLFWAMEVFVRRSPAPLLRYFEPWKDGDRLRHQFRHLERANLIKSGGPKHAKTYRLTPAGHLAVWGGVDPAQRWTRPWDGFWRLVLFDLPQKNPGRRSHLWRWLRAQHFGFLQNSLWITPDPIDETCFPLRRADCGVEVLAILEGQPGPGSTHAEIVQGAWDIAAINEAYRGYLKVVAAGDKLAVREDPPSRRIREWLSAEREAWLWAAGKDPFLPEALLPRDYLGRRAWKSRGRVMKKLLQSKLSEE